MKKVHSLVGELDLHCQYLNKSTVFKINSTIAYDQFKRNMLRKIRSRIDDQQIIVISYHNNSFGHTLRLKSANLSRQ